MADRRSPAGDRLRETDCGRGRSGLAGTDGEGEGRAEGGIGAVWAFGGGDEAGEGSGGGGRGGWIGARDIDDTGDCAGAGARRSLRSARKLVSSAACWAMRRRNSSICASVFFSSASSRVARASCCAGVTVPPRAKTTALADFADAVASSTEATGGESPKFGGCGRLRKTDTVARGRLTWC
jgi:hypothetical protein